MSNPNEKAEWTKEVWFVWILEEWDDWFYVGKAKVVKMDCRYPQTCENCDKPAVWSWRSKVEDSAYYNGSGVDDYHNILMKNLCDDCDFKDILINSGALDEET